MNFFWIFLFALFVTTGIAKAENQKSAGFIVSSNHLTPNENDLRILEVKVKSYKFDEEISAYQFQNSIFIPLGYFSQLIEIAIESNPAEGIAQGFFFNEKNQFFLDTLRNEVTINGKPEKYNEKQIYVLDDDIYVDSNLFQEWFSITLDINLFASSIKIFSKEPLAFEKRKSREERIAKTRSRLNIRKDTYPKHDESYEIISAPFIDQSIETNLRNANGKHTSELKYTTQLTTDLLKHESSFYISGSDKDAVTDSRFTLSKHDPDSQLLGFLEASAYSAGNITESKRSLITSPSGQTVGLDINNLPLQRQQEYDQHRFIGNLLPGWEVELYRNNSLLAYKGEPVNGQYEFNNVPLLFGNNYFKLIFYGPLGETREEEYYFVLGEELIKEGDQYYRATISKDEISNSNRTLLQYNVGINKQLSASVDYISIPLTLGLNNFQHDYLATKLNAFFKALYITFDYINDNQSGNAYEIAVQSKLGDTIIAASEVKFNEFFSEEFKLSSQQLNSRKTLSINTSFAPSFMPGISISLESIFDDFVTNTTKEQHINTLSTHAYGIAISNQLTLIKNTSLPDTLTGSLQLNTRMASVNTRGTINYEIKPFSETTSISLSANPQEKFGDYYLNFGINQNIIQNSTDFNFTASKSIGDYSLSFGGNYNTNKEFTLNARLSLGLGHEPRQNQWYSSSTSLAAYGAVSANVFLDDNQDGIKSNNEQVIPGVAFNINGHRRNIVTNKNGVAFISGLQAHNPIDLSVDNGTLEDTLWTSAIDGVRVTPRPGHTIELDFPIFAKGEIDGTVYVMKDGEKVGAGNVLVELIDMSNRVQKTIKTEYDGFYIISQIPIGAYRLRVAPDMLKKYGLFTLEDELVSITHKNPFQNGFDFTLHSNKNKSR